MIGAAAQAKVTTVMPEGASWHSAVYLTLQSKRIHTRA
jgi:hypothetical protein